jgi:hypothetical protein
MPEYSDEKTIFVDVSNLEFNFSDINNKTLVKRF